jgi:hypothetical protein
MGRAIGGARADDGDDIIVFGGIGDDGLDSPSIAGPVQDDIGDGRQGASVCGKASFDGTANDIEGESDGVDAVGGSFRADVAFGADFEKTGEQGGAAEAGFV